MGHEETILDHIIGIKGDIGGMKVDIEHIRDTGEKNTQQISEIRRSSPAPLPHAPIGTLGLVTKILPYIWGGLVGAAAVGAALSEAFSK
jgi:hypothetical protein